jgi:hypothetical protein
VDTSDAPSDFGVTARSLAGQLQKVMNATIAELDADNPATELLKRVTSHLDTELQHIVVVAEEFENWEHASSVASTPTCRRRTAGTRGSVWRVVIGGTKN